MASARVDLPILKEPIAIRTDCIAAHRTTIYVKQDRSWSNGNFTAKTADGSLILSCDGKVLSNSARKQFTNASGLPLFSLRSSWFSMSKAWTLELPGDGHVIMAVRPCWSLGRVKLDCTFTNAASNDGGQKVTLKVRGQDIQHLVTDISCRETKVASVKRIHDDGGKRPQFFFKPEYEIEVAQGMDTALVGYSLTSYWRGDY